MRLALGAGASMSLAGQRVLPRKALTVGHRFQFPTIEIGSSRDAPDVECLRERKPRYLLSKRTLVRAPLEDVFDFFARSDNFGAITPPNMMFELDASNSTRMHDGREIEYAFRIGPLGALAQRSWIAPPSRAIFSYRARMLRLRFGTGSLDATSMPPA